MINDDINNVINELDKYSGVDFVFGGAALPRVFCSG